jgi:hypothetical protein
MNQRAWKVAVAVVIGTSLLAAIAIGLALYLERLHPSPEEALIAHELSEGYLGENAGFCPCYISVDGSDPSPDVIQRLSRSHLTFLPRSSWREETGGMRIRIGAPEQQLFGLWFSIKYSYNCGMVCGGAGTAAMWRVPGGWRVFRSDLEWIT